MLASLFAGLVLFLAPAPLVLDLAPHDGAPACRPVRLVKVGADGSLRLRGQLVEKSRIVQAMGRVTADECERVYILADDGAPYGAVFGLISTLRAAGFRQIALVDRPWEPSAP